MRLVVGLCVAALLAATLGAVADARTFRGHTTQSRTTSVVTNKAGVPVRVRVSWAAKCSKGSFAATTIFARLPNATRTRATETLSSTLREPKGIRSLITTSVRLNRVVAGGNVRWSGRFTARVTVRRNGQTIDRCIPRPVGVRAA